MVLNIINHLHSICHKKVNYVRVVQADTRELACTVKKSALKGMCFSDVHRWVYIYEVVCTYLHGHDPTMHSRKAYALKGQKLHCQFFLMNVAG